MSVKTLKRYSYNVRKTNLVSVVSRALSVVSGAAAKRVYERIDQTTTKRTGTLLESVGASAKGTFLTLDVAAPYAAYLSEDRHFTQPLYEMEDLLTPAIQEELSKSFNGIG